MDKRTEQINTRISKETKEKIKEISDKNRWTLSQTVAIICEEYLKNKGKE